MDQVIARPAGLDGKVSPHWCRHGHTPHVLERDAATHLVQATLDYAPGGHDGALLARAADGQLVAIPEHLARLIHGIQAWSRAEGARRRQSVAPGWCELRCRQSWGP